MRAMRAGAKVKVRLAILGSCGEARWRVTAPAISRAGSQVDEGREGRGGSEGPSKSRFANEEAGSESGSWAAGPEGGRSVGFGVATLSEDCQASDSGVRLCSRYTRAALRPGLGGGDFMVRLHRGEGTQTVEAADSGTGKTSVGAGGMMQWRLFERVMRGAERDGGGSSERGRGWRCVFGFARVQIMTDGRRTDGGGEVSHLD